MTTNPNLKQRIGILGGTFNPPTNAHLQMAVEAINRSYVNEVWFVPSGYDPQNFNQTDPFIRLNMINMAVKDYFHSEFPIEVKDIEIVNGISIPTYNLMKSFIDNKQPQQEFCFMIGQDLLQNLQSWDYSEELRNEIPFLIFKRIQNEIDITLLPKSYQIIDTTFVAASSTEIRQRIKRNLNINFIEKEEKDKFSNTSFSENTKLPKKFPIQSGRFIKHEQQCNQFSQKYLGVYGLIPTCIINYIKENQIYA